MGAISDHQWAGLMQGDVGYAGSRNFARLRAAVQELLGFDLVIPCHQGRGAENVLDAALVLEGSVVLGNVPFDATARRSMVPCHRMARCRGDAPFARVAPS